jgi:WD40 repeat protein
LRQAGLWSHDIPLRENIAVAFSPDGRLLATAEGDGRLLLWGPNVLTPKRTLAERQVTVGLDGVAFSPDGWLVASGGNVPVRFWSVADGTVVGDLADYPNLGFGTVVFSPNGKLLVTGGLQLWQLDDTAHIALVEGHISVGGGGSVNSFAFSPNGQLLASG